MAVGPELVERAGIWISEGGLSEDIKCAFCRGLRVGHQTMDCLLAVDIGGVLVVAAEHILYRLQQRAEYGKREQ